ncbi:deoxyribonuclease-1-like [Liolophura sinensis]|uniref:deoxyribonuclease-1-like n=1 Tax=Liolophura sinensis TaxID=3198878 RepID=UPI003159310F
MANRFVSVLCVVGLWTALVHSLAEISPEPLRIAAFNIRVFGIKKLRNAEVKATLAKFVLSSAQFFKAPLQFVLSSVVFVLAPLQFLLSSVLFLPAPLQFFLSCVVFAMTFVLFVLYQIIQRYDLVVVQEIRDSTSTAFTMLKEELNKLSPLAPFDTVVSERLGRSNSKEQYGFLFRPSRLTPTGVYQFDDDINNSTDVFEREPFAVRFHCAFTELQDFAVIATHIAPRDAVAEIDKLTYVYHEVGDHWDLEAVLLAGDFNADCSYLRGAKWENVSLRTDEEFHWLIADSEDTTVTYSDCSYDRFVTASADILTNLVPGSVRVYHFDADLKLTYKEALAISDHYPIELQLKTRVNREIQARYRSGISFVVSSDDPVTNNNDIRRIYRKRNHWLSTHVFYDTSRMQHVTATMFHVRDVLGKLLKFSKTYPRVLSDDLLALVDAYLATPQFTTNVFINGLDIQATHHYDVTVTCRLQSPYTCEVKVTKFLT